MVAQHTRGPWTARGRRVSPDRETLETAPELLETCKALAVLCSEYPEARAKAEAVIAKAEGR